MTNGCLKGIHLSQEEHSFTMNYIVENLTRRPVTLLGNSGKSYHLPPRYSLQLAAIELSGNAFVKKLEERCVVAVKEADKTGKTPVAKRKDLPE